MFKPIQNFHLRPGPALDPSSQTVITTDQGIDLVDDAGNGWAKVKAYDRDRVTAEGFARREWLQLVEVDPEIDKVKFIAACFLGAWDFHTSAPYLIAVAQIESETKNVPATNSSAFGPFQILAETWSENIADPRIGFSEPDRYDPYRQPIVAAKIAADGTAALRQILPGNVDPTPPELYFSHLFGVNGARIILNAANRGLLITQALASVYPGNPDRVAKVVAANKPLLAPNDQPRPVQEILDDVGARLKAALAASVPTDIAGVTDPLSAKEAVAMAVSGDTSYWVVNMSGDEEGGQALIKQSGQDAPQVVASDTTLLPIDPNLVATNVVPADIAEKLNKSLEAGAPQPGPQGNPPQPGQDVNQLILAAATACDDHLATGNAPNTNHGRLACAWAVNHVVQQAIGRPAGGGVSTARMFDVLRQHAPIPEAQAVAGNIVISPTVGGNVGHVGIVGQIAANRDDTRIYSNSSSRAMFSHAFTLKSWKSYFSTKKGLQVLFFDVG